MGVGQLCPAISPPAGGLCGPADLRQCLDLDSDDRGGRARSPLFFQRWLQLLSARADRGLSPTQGVCADRQTWTTAQARARTTPGVGLRPTGQREETRPPHLAHHAGMLWGETFGRAWLEDQ